MLPSNKNSGYAANYTAGYTAGYTLMEILVVIALVSILTSIAIPSFQNMIANGKMSSHTTALAGAFNFARLEAVKRRANIVVEPFTANDWTSGVEVWVDTNRDSVKDAGEEVLRELDPVDATMTLVGSDNSMIFLSTGFIGGAATTTFQFCDDRTGETGSVISVLVSGRIKIMDDNTCT